MENDRESTIVRASPSRRLIGFCGTILSGLAHTLSTCVVLLVRLVFTVAGAGLTLLYGYTSLVFLYAVCYPVYGADGLTIWYFMAGSLLTILVFFQKQIRWFFSSDQKRISTTKRHELRTSDYPCEDYIRFSGHGCPTKIIDSPWWILPFSLFFAPGFFAVIPGLVIMQVGYPYAYTNYSMMLGSLLTFPAIASIKLFLLLTNRYYSIKIGPAGMLVLSGSTPAQSILWDNVAEVTLTKLARVKESNYHADDLDQQQVVLSNDRGDQVTIDLYTLSQRQRTELARVLQTNLKMKVFTDSGLSFLKQLCLPEPAEMSIDSKKLEVSSFTEMWEGDMKRHIGRTNYVPLAIGAELQSGRIKVKSYLSSGGFSTIYIASRESLSDDDRVIVIKESSLPQGLNDEARQKISDMFSREARLLQKCNHPRIAKVLDFFHEDGREYLALEYLNGTRLSDVVSKESRASERQCISWAIELAELLEYLHGMEPPIIHRDFTPDNIILPASGHLHLIDFGAANEFLGGATGTLVGKQSYIAPEQFQGKATTGSDIYALGATLFFILTAQEPLPLSASRPKELRSDISDELDELIARCTEPDSSRRIASAGELVRSLQQLQSSCLTADCNGIDSSVPTLMK